MHAILQTCDGLKGGRWTILKGGNRGKVADAIGDSDALWGLMAGVGV
jgi:hypothetical protein